jgi:Acetyltransferase (GNAT) family
MLKIEQIFPKQVIEFQEVIAIYHNQFPENERQPIDVLIPRLNTDLEQLYVGKFNEEIVAIGFVYNLPNTDFLLLDYLAISKNNQQNGLGSEFFKEIIKIAELQNKQLLMEVDNPDFEPEKDLKTKRVAFYKKNGAEPINGIRYILPALDGTNTTEQILMYVPNNNNCDLQKPDLINLVSVLYKELYNKPEEDIDLKKIINSIEMNY